MVAAVAPHGNNNKRMQHFILLLFERTQPISPLLANIDKALYLPYRAK